MIRRAMSVVLVGFGVFGVAGAGEAYASPKEIVTANDTDEVELMVKGQYVFVTTQRASTIRLYSILGQLIVQQSVQAGTTRIKAPTRGVYILQVGSTTRRITIN